MNIVDQWLEKKGLKFEELTVDERTTYTGMLEMLGKSELSLAKLKDYITAMRESVEQELTKTDHNSKQDLFLKARLRNYILLEGFLTGPERARKILEQQLGS